MRVIGLDLGTKTLGVAISDPSKIIASSLTTIRFEENDYKSAIKELKNIISDYEIELIVIGLPKNMNNSLGFAAQRTLDFEKLLKDEFEIPIYEQDERLSSVTANNILLEADVSRRKRKKKVDQLAATIILQNYLDIRKGIQDE